jgi:hypothetical protein
MIGYSSSPSHRCDEFPAEYSSASCSPAWLACASPAALMLQPTTFVRRAKLSERKPGNSSAVSAEGFTPNVAGNYGKSDGKRNDHNNLPPVFRQTTSRSREFAGKTLSQIGTSAARPKQVATSILLESDDQLSSRQLEFVERTKGGRLRHAEFRRSID